MKKVLGALLAVVLLAACAWALSTPIIVTGATDPYSPIKMGIVDGQQRDILVYKNGDENFDLSAQVLFLPERTAKFLFDMGNISEDPTSRAKGQFSVLEGMTITYPENTVVKHSVNVYGPGVLALGGEGYWEGTTVIAYDYLVSKDIVGGVEKEVSVTSRDGYLRLLSDNALPTWNPVIINIPSTDQYMRAVLDLNGYSQMIGDLVNSYDTTGMKHDGTGLTLEGVVHLEGARNKNTPNVEGRAGTLLLRSSKNGANTLSNDLGRITGYGEVRLYNNLTTYAPTVFDIVSKEPGTGSRSGLTGDDESAALGLVGFHFGNGTKIGDQVTLRVNDRDKTKQQVVRVRYLSGGVGDSILDLSGMQYDKALPTARTSADVLIVDTDNDYTYWGKFSFPNYSDNLYTEKDKWEPNFIKTGVGTQTVTEKALTAGAVFKVDSKKNDNNSYGYTTASMDFSGISNLYNDGMLRFLLENNADFSAFSATTARPVFLPGAGWYGFDTDPDPLKSRSANVDMLMDTDAGQNRWPSYVGTAWQVNYNELLPFENANVRVFNGTLAGAIFGKAVSEDIVPGNSALGAGAEILDPELELIAKRTSPQKINFAFKPIKDETSKLQIDGPATVVLQPWSWSSLGTLVDSTGTLVMDSPSSLLYGYTNPTYTFLRITRDSLLDVDLRDQYHRAVLMLGVDQGKDIGGGTQGTLGWRTRYFVIGSNFESNVKKIIVSRGAGLNVQDYERKEINSSVAFYGTNDEEIEPATYRVNVKASDNTDGSALSPSSELALKDGNQFTFADPVDLENNVEGSVKIDFRGSARAGNVFRILRGQNASDGAYRFVVAQASRWELFYKEEELGRNLYARALVDMLTPEVIGVGQPGTNEWTLIEANSKMALGVIVTPSTGILGYKYEGEALPAGVTFDTRTGYFNFRGDVTEPFAGTVSAQNVYGWGNAYTVKFVVKAAPTPGTQTDTGMAVAAAGAITSYKAGDPVSVTYTFDTKYDMSTVQAVTLPSGWTMTVDAANHTVTVTGTMPDSSVSFYFTALSTLDNRTYKSDTLTITKISVTPDPDPDKKDSSGGGGCNGGFAFAALALCLAVLKRR